MTLLYLLSISNFNINKITKFLSFVNRKQMIVNPDIAIVMKVLYSIASRLGSSDIAF